MQLINRITWIVILIINTLNAGGGERINVTNASSQNPPILIYLPEIPTASCADRAVIVNSVADSGPGTLRQALLDAQKGDVISFDPLVFPPQAPATIHVLSSLPSLQQNCLTIDASNAGVVLDGSAAQDPVGLNLDSDQNIIRGLRIILFSGPAIMLNATANSNLIGGDRLTGSGPTGQGNHLSLNGAGIGINGGNHNQLAGNLIGVKTNGTDLELNDSSAVFFNQGASYNILGPDNWIAVSGIPAVEIQCATCVGNSASRVRITSELSMAIAYTGPGESIRPEPPVIMEFNQTLGQVSGFAAPNSQVEVYSFQTGGSTHFEGAVQVDANGDFSMDVGESFSGPGLTAFAVEPGKGVTPFSEVITGTSRHLEMQLNNPQGKRPLVFQPSSAASPSWIGETFSDVNADQMPDPAGLANFSRLSGHSWIRFSFSEFSWWGFQQTGHYSPLVFGEYHDQVVQSFVDHQITAMYNLTFFDPEIEVSTGYVRFKDEAEIQRYLDYVEMIATRYKGKIPYYESWNEADLDHIGDQQSLDMVDYIAVVKRLIPVIKAADPQAKVVLGASSALHGPLAQAYLTGLLESELMPLVDGIAIHPMYGDSPDYDRFRDYYLNYDSMMAGYQQTAASHGFTGEWFAEEMVWRVQENVVINEPEYYSHPVAVKYYARGITINRAMGIYPGIGGEDHHAVAGQVKLEQGLNTLFSGIQPLTVEVQINQPAIQLRHYAFSLPAGGVMVVLWNDATAADNDPGTLVEVTIHGQTGTQVIGKDPLLGYIQVLQTQGTGGNTVISDFLIKDYPQFIVLEN